MEPTASLTMSVTLDMTGSWITFASSVTDVSGNIVTTPLPANPAGAELRLYEYPVTGGLSGDRPDARQQSFSDDDCRVHAAQLRAQPPHQPCHPYFAGYSRHGRRRSGQSEPLAVPGRSGGQSGSCWRYALRYRRGLFPGRGRRACQHHQFDLRHRDSVRTADACYPAGRLRADGSGCLGPSDLAAFVAIHQAE